MPFFLIFLLLILVEIALFVLIGGHIGVWAVLAITLLSMLLGLGVLRYQGARSAALARGGLAHVSLGSFMAQGAFALLAGGLLLLPGLLTDVAGLLLLLPPLQRLLMRALAARLGPHQQEPQEAEIVEGSFSVDDQADPSAPSGGPDSRRRLDAPNRTGNTRHPPRGPGTQGPHRGH